MYCQKLVEMEYLWAIVSANGKPSVYQLTGDMESEVHTLRGLTSVDELRKKLSVVGGQWSEKAEAVGVK